MRAPSVELQRSRMVMAACDGLITRRLPGIGGQVRIEVRPQGSTSWQACLFASDGPAGISAVAAREADLAIINPSALLTLAYRGNNRHFPMPVPVRAITVLPQRDFVGLAVRADTGLRYLEDVAEARYPLRISWRGQRADHSIHLVLADILEAAGCPVHAIEAWGGQVFYDTGLFPSELRPGVKGRVRLVAESERDALFDEGAPKWWQGALDAGMTFLSLREETIGRLVALGYRQSTMSKDDYHGLAVDTETIDFSGWPLFTHAETPDDVVTAFCEGLEANKERMPFEKEGLLAADGQGPFPLERMCNGPADGPLDVPLHPAARRFWHEKGYL